ncbi:MAG: hypothetical protein ACKVQB_02835 [Bacteroidia bacterium]
MPVNKTIILVFVLSAFQSKATIFPSPQGPFTLGLGTISAFKTDPFVAYNHQGSLAFTKHNSISLGIQSQYFVEGLSMACFSGNYKISKTQTFGIGYSYFGNQFYNEGLLKVSLAKKFSNNFGGGISLDYLRLQLPKESCRVKHLLTFEAGIYSKFSSDFEFALQLVNPARVPLSGYDDERLPFVTNTSLFYNANKQLTIAAEWSQVMNGKGNLKVGLNYALSSIFYISAGVYNKPINPAFGISYKGSKINIHLAFAMHPYLNAISSGGITYTPLIKRHGNDF